LLDQEAALFGDAAVSRSHEPFELSFAFQGADAVELVRRAVESGRRYAAVFTDIRMPPGWDGLATAVKLWEIDPDLQIVICTAYSDKSWGEMMQVVTHPERVLILKKPFDTIEVLQLAHALTEKWSLLQTSRRNMQELEAAVEVRTRELREANSKLEAEIATRKATEAALRKSERAIREKAALLDKAQDAIFVHDLSGKSLYWNRSAERLYEWTAPEMMGQEVYHRIGGDSKLLDEARLKVVAIGDWVGELAQRSRSGSNVLVESRWTLVRDDHGQPAAILVINTDVAEKRQLEANFLRVQRMESIGALAGGIAHDLNNILQPITLAMEVFRSQLTASGDSAMLDLVIANADRATLLVRQVLSFARGAQGPRIPIFPNTLLEEMGVIIRETFPKSIRLVLNDLPDVWTFWGDSTQFHQVLLNLCVNARDAMPTGGTLTLATENVEIDEFEAAMMPGAVSGRYGVFVVTDTGTGIPAAVRDKIFDPFFTTKEQGKGTGIGLATTLGIVRNHGGFIRVESQEGVGTTFRVYLPAADAPAVPASRASSQRSDFRGDGATILVVDDEAAILALMRITLESVGYDVLTCENGIEGIKTYTRHPGRIDAVITDIHMPAMDGATMIAALKKIDPEIKVIAMTGSSSEEGIVEIDHLGVERALPKPSSPQMILSALGEILEKAATEVR
jgi:PAS domain S-box-containing protein